MKWMSWLLLGCGVVGCVAVDGARREDAGSLARDMIDIDLDADANMIAELYLRCYTGDDGAVEELLASWLTAAGADDAEALAATAMDDDYCGTQGGALDSAHEDAEQEAMDALSDAGLDASNPLSDGDESAQANAIADFESFIDDIMDILFEYVELIGPGGERVCIWL